MRTVFCSLAAGIAVLGLVCSARADEEAKKVVEKAIQAHGGAEKLAKAKDKSVMMKGKLKILDPMELDATMEMWAGGKKFKQNLQLTVMGMDIMQAVAYDGKELWIAINGKVFMTLNKEDELKAIKEMMHAEELAGLTLLGDKNIELSIIGEDKVNDVPVVGVRVSSKGYKDVSLYFDKNTGLLAKMENRALDFQTQQEVSQERIMSEYKEFEGFKRPSKVAILKEGKKFVEIEVTEVKIVDKLDDDTFEKPK
jgi:hypothetical protein